MTEDVMPVVADTIYAMGSSRGFAGQRTDYPSRAITVYWQGAAPDDVRDYVSSSPLGVSVKLIEGVPHSRSDSEAARARLLVSDVRKNLDIVSISVDYTGAGLRVVIAGADADLSKAVGQLREAADFESIDVSSIDARSDRLLVATRTNDAPGWKGGGRMKQTYGGYTYNCSTGFAVLDGPYGRLISANHCDPTASHAVVDGNGDSIAPSTALSHVPALDSMLIDPSASPATQASVFYGSYATSTLKTVKSWASNWPGDPVCVGGASTGTHCGTIYDDNDYALNVNGYDVPVIDASAPAGAYMAGPGDSGGPVTKNVTGGVQARGILLGYDLAHPSTSTCGSVNPDVNRSGYPCYRYIQYVPISLILNSWGVSLETA